MAEHRPGLAQAVGPCQMKVVWLTPYGPEKLWDPALRLRRWNVHQHLCTMGVESVFVWWCYHLSDAEVMERTLGADVVVFTEQSSREVAWMRALKAKGVTMLRDHCELLFGFENQLESFQEADLVVCSSEVVQEQTLAKHYKQWEGTIHIPDMWEPAPLCKVSDKTQGLKAVFMGTGVPIQMLQGALGDAVRTAGYELILITNEDRVGTPWKADTWAELYASADVALCPQDPTIFPGKSPVKVTQALGCGYPTIASPLRSYASALGGGAGIIAGDVREWYDALVRLRDPSERLRLHVRALERSAIYSPDAIAKQWYSAMLTQIANNNSV